ncbi:MAG: SGNH/GDSL hydrolase family protein [Betaproteobacteria bacterium]|jgi:lysophospholipase L1-like esterase|nr:MAG: SGNH/GDSL hydrolase family protein [Betaproteobacteria bacterium]
MKHILVYSDSLTWGIIPSTRKRLAFDERWPGVMENELNTASPQFRVIENCLNGRRTAWDDPFKPGRNGLEGVQQVIEMHSPLSLVVLMLGTNDFQSMHPHNAWHAAQGIRSLLSAIRQAPIEPGMSVPRILLVVPPLIQAPKGPIAPKFAGGEVKCQGLAKEYQIVAEEMECSYFDSSSVTTSSKVDGIHLDKDQHHTLGKALAGVVRELTE